MKSTQDVWAIVNGLKGLYPDGICSLQYQKDYELLFSVRLSAQCTDARVNQVTPALFARFPTLESFAAADPAEVAEYIHSCGFYNGKSRDLVGCAQMLLSDWASPTAPRTRPRWKNSCEPSCRRRSPTTSVTGWYCTVEPCAPPAPPSANCVPSATGVTTFSATPPTASN